MPIHSWPISDRPREKLLAQGAHSLSDAELLAIFFRTGIPGKTALDLARELLTEFGNLKTLLNSSEHAIYEKKGIGKAKFAILKAALELSRRYEEIEVGEILINSENTKQFLKNRLAHYRHEVFACLLLNNSNKVICFKELFHGTLTGASVYPREVVKQCLENNAAKIIFAHNHPGGNVTPSQADRAATQMLKETLALIEVSVLDHIVVSKVDVFSFAEAGFV